MLDSIHHLHPRTQYTCLHGPVEVCCGGLTWTAGPLGRTADLLFAFLKNRGFGKKRVSNFTKSSSGFSGFFGVLLLPCEDEQPGGRRRILSQAWCGTLPGSHPQGKKPGQHSKGGAGGLCTLRPLAHSPLFLQLCLEPSCSAEQTSRHHAGRGHSVFSAVKAVSFLVTAF